MNFRKQVTFLQISYVCPKQTDSQISFCVQSVEMYHTPFSLYKTPLYAREENESEKGKRWLGVIMKTPDPAWPTLEKSLLCGTTGLSCAHSPGGPPDSPPSQIPVV